MNIVLYPNAKINVGLRVLNRREDGYHNIETVFVPLATHNDILELVEASELELHSYGIDYELKDGNIENDLCVKAYRAIAKDFDIPPVHIHLYKGIPTGAGMGGGSSDAASVISGLNSMFRLGLSKARRAKYAAQIGSDCAFFIYNIPMLGEGRGEILTPCESQQIKNIVSGDKYYIKVETPGVHVSTAQAYSSLTPDMSGHGLTALLERPIEEWKDTVLNDFEKTVFAQHPSLADIKADFYAQGAVYASMSGSGSSVYAIFKA